MAAYQPRRSQASRLLQIVAWAAEFFAPHGLDVVIEPITPVTFRYFLNDFPSRATDQ